MYRGKLRFHYLTRNTVTDPCDLHIIGNSKSDLLQISHGTNCHGICGTYQRINGWILLKKFLRHLIAGIHGEASCFHLLRKDLKLSLMKRIHKTFFTACTNCLVFICDTNVSELFSFLCKLLCHHKSCLIIILINAGISIQMLSQKHDRHLIILQHLFMLSGKHGGNKNHSVHLAFFKQRKIFQLFFHIVVGIGEDQLVTSPCENVTDPRHLTAYGIGIDLWKNNTDETRFFCPQCLCLGGWLISGLLDHLADDFFFFTAYISVVQISGYRSSGNSGKSGYFINIHDLCTSSSVLLSLSFSVVLQIFIDRLYTFSFR